MASETQDQSQLLKLHRVVPDQGVEVYKVSPKELARFTQCQTARPAEVQGLIEELLQQLPEQERQEFKMKIRTEAMI